MQKLKKNALLLCLSTFIFSGCVNFPKMPEGHLYQLNTKDGVAYEYDMPKTIDDVPVYNGNDIYIIHMDNYLCVSPRYEARLRNWLKDVEKYAEDKCSD